MFLIHFSTLSKLIILALVYDCRKNNKSYNLLLFRHGSGTFSVKGIEICIQFFTDRGHKDVIALIPIHRQGPPGSERKNRLNKLYNKGQVCFTPSRKIHNLRMTCHDDR